MNKVYLIYFSPTGNSYKVGYAIASVLANRLNVNLNEINITIPSNRNKKYEFNTDDLIVCAIPTYAGRIPNKILPFFQNNLLGDKTKVVSIVTYGNRNYDNSLIELNTELTKNNFIIISSGAVVCEHAFTNKLATNRPNAMDQRDFVSFALATFSKLKMDITKSIEVKGDKEYSKYYQPLMLDNKPAIFLKATPVVDENKCIKCGKCVDVCPMGIISVKDKTEFNGPCIKCQACIKKCNQSALSFIDEAFLSHVSMLEKNYTVKKENEWFI